MAIGKASGNYVAQDCCQVAFVTAPPVSGTAVKRVTNKAISAEQLFREGINELPGSGAMHEQRTPLRSPLSPAFRMAVLAGARESVLLHLRSHSDVDAADESGRSPLILAASKGRLDICRLLLEAGADPTLKDNDGNDAVATAISRGQSQLADILRETFARRHPQSKDEAKTGSVSAESPQEPDVSGAVHPGSGSDQPRSSAPPSGEAPPPKVLQVDLGSPAAELLHDISSWQVENETPISENDPSCASEAGVLQDAISSHEVIDKDEGWEEVEIDLP